MIRIERTECPACLTDAASEGSAFRKKEVVEALWRMQNGKCCYSEMLIPSEGHGKAVEHFHPQSIFGWRRNDWDNMLLVCPQCNGRKSDRFPVMLTINEDETKIVYLQSPSDAMPAIIDPSDPTDDPAQHLTYVLDDSDPLYGQVIPRNNSARGRLTIEVTGIDDDVFFRERFGRLIDTLDVLYRNILRAKRDGDQDALNGYLLTLVDYLKSKAKFAGLAREYARYKKLDKHFAVQVPGGVPRRAQRRRRS